MYPPLTEEILVQIMVRDEQAGEGLVVLDNEAAMDRHLLIGEVYRLQGVIARLREGRPVR